MRTTERFYVRIDRTTDDGSRTYKGAWSRAHCQREADAWRESFPGYVVDVVAVADARADFRAWSRATREGGRYFPPVTYDTTVDAVSAALNA